MLPQIEVLLGPSELLNQIFLFTSEYSISKWTFLES